MKESQNKWVLRYLQSGKRLSSRDAVLAYGIQDLPKRISDLRQSGVEIESARVNGTGRNGKATHWSVYWMVKHD